MRRTSSWASLTTAATVAVLAAACSSSTSSGTNPSSPANSPSAATTLKLAYLPSFQDPYFVQEARGAEAEAKKLGIQLVVENANGSDSAAVNNLQTLITTGGVKGVLIAVPTQQIGPQVATMARQAGVPLIATDNQISGMPFVGFQWAAIGSQAGTMMAHLFDSAQWAPSTTSAVSIELPSLQTCNDRTNAETAAFLASAPGFPKTNVVHLSYDGTENGALTAMATAKTAHPGTTHWVIWSCNDDGVVGAIRALTSAGVPAANIIGVGVNANLACPVWGAGQTQAFRQAIFTDPARTGALGIQELYSYLTAHTQIPANSALGGVVVNPTDYTQLMKGYINC
jgi:L-arabinose transport system substrate-binding protein